MRKRFIAAFLALFCAIALSTTTAVGTAEINANKSITLTLRYSNGGTRLSGVTFYLYKVGDYISGPGSDGTYSFKATSAFEDFDGAETALSGLTIEYGSTSELTELAAALDEYAAKNVAAPEGHTTVEGETGFTGLEPGLYLVRGETKKIGGTTYIPQTFLIPLPYPTDNGFSYKVTANVKPITQTDQPATGSLTVKKTVDGSEGETNRDFHFIVKLNNSNISGTYGGMTFDNGVATFMLKHNQSKTATDLPAGISYKVTETEANLDGYETTTSGDTGTILKDRTVAASFINTKDKESGSDTGNLIVVKTVAGSAGDIEQEFTFTVTLGDSEFNGTYGDMTFVNGVATIKLKHGDSAQATGLPADITYTVTEAEADQDGYETTAIGDTGTIVGDRTAMANFTNTREEEDGPDKGNLIVIKTVVGSAGDTEQEFTFTVTLSDTSITGTYDGMTFVNGVATIKLKHGDSAQAMGLPAGITYTVTEAEADQDGYETTAVGDTGTILKDHTVAASFINTKDEESGSDTGNLIVVKTVVGSEGDKEQEFTFTVTLSDTSITGTYDGMTFVNGVATIKLKHGDSAQATGLPADITYTVTEAEADQDGYETTAIGDTGTILKDRTVAASFINTRDEEIDPDKKGNLTVSKTVDGNTGDRYQEFTFTVTLTPPDDAEWPEGLAMTYTFTLRHSQSWTLEGLPAGTEYTVTESGADEYVITATGDTGTIPDGGTAAAGFINTRDEEIDPGVGNLTVRKVVGGNTGEKTRDFTFAVVLSDNTINGTYGGMTFVNGVAAFTLRHGESRTATGLPAGITYSVMEAEANQNGYTTSSKNRDGTIPEQGSVQATFNNTRGVSMPEDPPLEEFDDPDIPLGGFPNFPDVPKTGDNSHPALWLSLMILSAIGLVLTVFCFNGKRNLFSAKSKHMKK